MIKTETFERARRNLILGPILNSAFWSKKLHNLAYREGQIDTDSHSSSQCVHNKLTQMCSSITGAGDCGLCKAKSSLAVGTKCDLITGDYHKETSHDFKQQT